MAQLGDIYLDVVSQESPSYSVNSTDHAVEDGGNIVDHVKASPATISIDGLILGEYTSPRKVKIQRYMHEGKQLTYRYRNLMYNCIIKSFDTSHHKGVADGFEFSITLKEIKTAKSPNIINVNDYIRRQIKQVSNAGRKQLA